MMMKVRIRYSELITSSFLGGCSREKYNFVCTLLDLPFTFLADVNEILLFNDSPQISGNSLTVDYIISGCAQVLCQVRARTPEFDCEYNYYIH